MQSGIYRITNLITGRVYIGQSVNIEQRWSEHVGGLKNGRHANRLLQEEWNQFGKSAFIFEKIEQITDKSLLTERENYWIEVYRSNCYNWKRPSRNNVKKEDVIVFLTEPERRALLVLSGGMGISRSKWLVKVIRDEYRDFFGEEVKE